MNNWQLQIRKGQSIVAAFFPLSDQEHIRVVLREGYSFWKRQVTVDSNGELSEWEEYRFKPGHYVIILGYNDCAINSDTQHEELLKKVDKLQADNEFLRLATIVSCNNTLRVIAMSNKHDKTTK